MAIIIILSLMAILGIALYLRKKKLPKSGTGGSYQEPTGGKGKDQNEQQQVN